MKEGGCETCLGMLLTHSCSIKEKRSQPLQTVTGRGDQCKTVANNMSPASENTLYSVDLFLVDHQFSFMFSKFLISLTVFLPSSPTLSRDRGMFSRSRGCRGLSSRIRRHISLQRSYVCNAAQNAPVMIARIMPLLVLHFTRPLKYVFWIESQFGKIKAIMRGLRPCECEIKFMFHFGSFKVRV